MMDSICDSIIWVRRRSEGSEGEGQESQYGRLYRFTLTTFTLFIFSWGMTLLVLSSFFELLLKRLIGKEEK